MTILHERIKHCLQTILDLQPRLRSLCRQQLSPEFAFLKDYLGRVPQMEICEEDVARIEKLAAIFLKEAAVIHPASKARQH